MTDSNAVKNSPACGRPEPAPPSGHAGAHPPVSARPSAISIIRGPGPWIKEAAVLADDGGK